MNNNEELICKLLLSTKRKGMETVVEKIHEAGFFTAPASAFNHLNYEGGLAMHSLNVCRIAIEMKEGVIKLRPEAEKKLQRDSIVIASLLHDVCKSDIYKITNRFRKNEEGRWETYKGYEADYTNLPVGHGEKSVIMLLRWGLDLTEDEILAIRWHMSAWDLSFQSRELRGSMSAAANKCPLLTLIQAADNIASHIIEL